MGQQIQVGQMISIGQTISIGKEEYLIKSQLGHGTSGIVFLVELRSTDNQQQFSQLAMKVRNSIESNEMEIMETLMNNQCPNLLNIRKYWQQNDKVFIIMDLAADGNLYEFMEKNKNALSPQAIQDIFIQLCLGVQQLHRLNIIHRDLKPENILLQLSPLTQKFIFKICDYGLSKKTSITNTKNIGTIYYMAPELLKNTGGYTKSIDIWALGCIWYSLVNNNEDLFTGVYQKDIQQSLQNATQPKIDIAIEKLKFNDWEKQLMKSMISIECNKRPNIEEILKKINQNKQFINQTQNNQNQQGSSVIFNSNTVKIIPQIPQNSQIVPNIQPNIQQNQSNIIKPIPQIIQNQQIIPSTQLNIQPNQSNIVKPIPQIPQIQQILPNQPNQPNIIKINPQITQNQPQQSQLNNNQGEENDKLSNLVQQLKQELKQYFIFIDSLVKLQVTDLQSQSSLRIDQVERQQKDIQNDIKTQRNTIESQNINLKQFFNKEISEFKSQFVQSKQDKEIMNLQQLIQKLGEESCTLSQQLKLIEMPYQQIQRLQYEQKLMTATIDKIQSNCEQKYAEQKEQIDQLLKSYKSIINEQEEMKSVANILSNQNSDFDKGLTKLSQELQEQQVKQKKQFDLPMESLQKEMKQLQNIFESRIMISIQKSDEEFKKIKQQFNVIQKNDQYIELKIYLEQIQKSHQEKMEKDIKIIEHNVEQQKTDLQTNFNSKFRELQQPSEGIAKFDLIIAKLQQDIQGLASAATIDKAISNYEQKYAEQKEQIDQLLKSYKSIINEQEEMKSVANLLSNKNSDFEKGLTKLSQELQEQQVKQKKQFDLPMESLQKEMKQLQNIFESRIMISIQKSDEEFEKIKQQFNVIQKNDQYIELKIYLEQIQKSHQEKMEKDIKIIEHNVEQQKTDLQTNFNSKFRELQQPSEGIAKFDLIIAKLQQDIQGLASAATIDKAISNYEQKYAEQKEQIDQLLKSYKSIINEQEEMKSVANLLSNKNSDFEKGLTKLSQELQEQQVKQKKQIDLPMESLQKEMKQLQNIFESRIMISIQKSDEEFEKIKQQFNVIQKNDQYIELKIYLEQIQKSHQEKMEKDIKIIEHNVEQQKTDLQTNFNSKFRELQQPSEGIAKFDLIIAKLQQDIQGLASAATIDKAISNYEQKYAEQKEQIDQLLKSYQSIINEQEEMKSVANLLSNKNSDFEKGLTKLSQELQEQQVKQKKQIDLPMESLQKEMKQLQNIFESRIMISIQKSDEEFEKIKQQFNVIQKNDQYIELKIYLEQIQKSHQEKMEKDIKIIEHNVQQQKTDLQTNFNSKFTELQQQSEGISKFDLIIAKLQQDIQGLASAATIDKAITNYEQKYAEQKEQIDQLLKSYQSIINEQEEMKSVANLLSNKNSDFEKGLTKLSQELQEQQVKQKKQFDLPMESLQKEMKQLQNIFESRIMISIQKSDEEFEKIKQQFNVIQKNDQYIELKIYLEQIQKSHQEKMEKDIKIIEHNVEQQKTDLQTNFNSKFRELQQPSEGISKFDLIIAKLQQDIQGLASAATIDKAISNYEQKYAEQKEQIDQLLKSYKSIINEQEEMKSVANLLSNKNSDFEKGLTKLSQELQEQQGKQKKQIDLPMESLQKEMKQLLNIFESRIMISIQKSDEEVKEIKQQFNVIQKNDQQIQHLSQEVKSMNSRIENVTIEQQKHSEFNIQQIKLNSEKLVNNEKQIQEMQEGMKQQTSKSENNIMISVKKITEKLKKQKEQLQLIGKPHYLIQRLQQEQKLMATTIDKIKSNYEQKYAEQKEQIYQLLKSYQSIINEQEQLKSVANLLSNKNSDFEKCLTKLSQELQEQQVKQKKQFDLPMESLQKEMKQLQNIFESRIMISIQKSDEEFEKIKQQFDVIQKNDQYIELKIYLEQIQKSHQEKMEKDIKIIEHNVEQQKTDLQTNFNSKFTELQQQSEGISKFDLIIAKLQQDIQGLASAATIDKTKSNYEQQYAEQKEQIDQLLKSYKSIINEQEEMKSVANLLSNKNSDFEKGLTKLSQELQEQQGKQKKQIDLPMESLQKEMKQLLNIFESRIMISIQKSDEEVKEIKQQFNVIQKNDQQIQHLSQEVKSMNSRIENVTIEQQKHSEFNIQQIKLNSEKLVNNEKQIQEMQEGMKQQTSKSENNIMISVKKITEKLKKQKEQLQLIGKPDQLIQRLQQEQKLMATTIDKIKSNYEQKYAEQKEQIDQLLKSYQSIINEQEEMKSVANLLSNKNSDFEKGLTKLSQELQEQQVKQKKQFDLPMESLQKEMKQLQNIFESRIMISIQKSDEEFEKIKQQFNVIQKNDQYIELKIYLEQIQKSHQEKMEKDIKIIEHNVEQQKTDLQTNFNSKFRELQQPSEGISKFDLIIAKLQQDIQGLASAATIDKAISNYEQKYAEQKEQIDQLLKSYKSIINEQEEMKSVANLLSNKNSDFEKGLTKLSQELQEQQGKQKKQIDLPMESLQKEMKQLLNIFESRIMISIQKSDEEVKEIKQQFNVIQKNDQQIQHLSQEVKSMNSRIENVTIEQQKHSEFNIQQIKLNSEKLVNNEKQIQEMQEGMKQQTSKSENNIMISVKKITEKLKKQKEQLQLIGKPHYLIQRLQQEQKLMAATIDKIKSNYEQKYAEQKEQIYQLLKSYQSIINEQEQLKSVANLLSNKNSDFEKCLTKLSQELQEQQVKQKKQFDLPMESLQKEMKQLQNIFESRIMISIQKSDEEFEKIKQQFDVIQKNDQYIELKIYLEQIQKSHQEKMEKDIKIIEHNVEQQKTDLQTNFNSKFTELQQQSEGISKFDLIIAKLQQDIQGLASAATIDKTKSNYEQQYAEQKEQIDQLLKSYQSIINEQEEMKSVANLLSNKNSDFEKGLTKLSQELQEQQVKQKKQIDLPMESLQKEMKQLQNIFESRIMISIQKSDEEFEKIKQQFDVIQKNDQYIELKIYLEQIQKSHQEKMEKDIKIIEHNVEQQKTDLQTNFNSKFTELQQQSEGISKFDLIIAKLQQDIQGLASAATIDKTKSNYEQQYAEQKEQIDQLLKSYQSIINEQEEMKSVANLLSNKNSDFEKGLTKLSQELQEQQVKQKKQIDLPMETLEKEMKQLLNIFESRIMISIQKSDEEFEKIKQQFNDQQIQHLSQEVKSMNSRIENVTIEQQKHSEFNIQQIKLNSEKLVNNEKQIQEMQEGMKQQTTNSENKLMISIGKIRDQIQKQKEQFQLIVKSDQLIQRLQQVQKLMAATIEKAKNNCQQKYAEQKEQIDQLLKSYKSIINEQEEMKSVANLLSNKNSDQEKGLTKLSQELQEQQGKQKKQIDLPMETLEKEMKQLLNIFESRIMISIQKSDEEFEKIKQQLNVIQKNDQQIYHLSQEVKSMNSRIENVTIEQQKHSEFNIQQIKLNSEKLINNEKQIQEMQEGMKQQTSKSENNIMISVKKITEKLKKQKKQLQLIDKPDQQIQSLQQEQKLMATTIDKTKSNEQKYAEQKEQIDQLLKSYQSIIYEQEEMKSVANLLSNKNSDFEKGLTKLSQELQEQQVKQKKQIDLSMETLQKEMIQLQNIFETRKMISMQKQDEKIEYQKYQFNRIQKNDQQLEKPYIDKDYVPISILDNKKYDEHKYFDSHIQQQQFQSEKRPVVQDKLIEQLQQDVKNLQNKIENTHIDAQRQFNQIFGEIRQQSNLLFNQNYTIETLQYQIKHLPNSFDYPKTFSYIKEDSNVLQWEQKKNQELVEKTTESQMCEMKDYIIGIAIKLKQIFDEDIIQLTEQFNQQMISDKKSQQQQLQHEMKQIRNQFEAQYSHTQYLQNEFYNYQKSAKEQQLKSKQQIEQLSNTLKDSQKIFQSNIELKTKVELLQSDNSKLNQKLDESIEKLESWMRSLVYDTEDSKNKLVLANQEIKKLQDWKDKHQSQVEQLIYEFQWLKGNQQIKQSPQTPNSHLVKSISMSPPKSKINKYSPQVNQIYRYGRWQYS